MNASRRHLVISPIGVDSVHRSWLSHPQQQSFDLLLIHYGGAQAGFGQDDATYYLERAGFKWELIHHALETHREIIDRYANIWCPDHDIRVDTLGINRLFELFEQHGLQLAQPAIAQGEVSYRIFRPRRDIILRYTPFVEIMCPLFTREAFQRVSSTFLDSRSGWGLDWVWPRFFQPGQMAILDQVGVAHTGKLFRAENYRKLADQGIHPQQEFQRVVAKYGGFDLRLHRKLVRGKIKLPALRDPGVARSAGTRLLESLGLRRKVA